LVLRSRVVVCDRVKVCHKGRGTKGRKKRATVPDNWYVPSYVVIRQAALKLGLDVLSGKSPRGRVGLFTPGHLAFSPSSLVFP
jgi:hypothetical protein